MYSFGGMEYFLTEKDFSVQDICHLSTIPKHNLSVTNKLFGYLFWLTIYLFEIDSYELLPQGGGEKKFSDRPLDGGGDRVT